MQAKATSEMAQLLSMTLSDSIERKRPFVSACSSYKFSPNSPSLSVLFRREESGSGISSRCPGRSRPVMVRALFGKDLGRESRIGQPPNLD